MYETVVLPLSDFSEMNRTFQQERLHLQDMILAQTGDERQRHNRQLTGLSGDGLSGDGVPAPRVHG